MSQLRRCDGEDGRLKAPVVDRKGSETQGADGPARRAALTSRVSRALRRPGRAAMMSAIVQDRRVSDEQAWAAVLARDVRLEGRVFYGVASTRVYCRPSCPSRRPLRRNAQF